jgi:hypothetical protein
MRQAFEIAFTEWERRYRENPSEFMSDAERLLGQTPQSYGEACAVYFEELLNQLAAGEPWNTIQRQAASTT